MSLEIALPLLIVLIAGILFAIAPQVFLEPNRPANGIGLTGWLIRALGIVLVAGVVILYLLSFARIC